MIKRIFLGIYTFLMITGCASTQSPIPKLEYFSENTPKSERKLLIALRGIGGSHKDFEKYGFIAALKEANPEFDVVVPNTHFGYYRERILRDVLYTEILKPALDAGYKEIWLAGVSLGGFGSLLMLADYTDSITGIVLIAPYSGEKKLHKRVKQHLDGEISASFLEPEASNEEQSDMRVDLWRWILENNNLLASGRIYLGYGDSDRLSGHDLIARLLPKENTVVVTGKHNPETFMKVWRELLSGKLFNQNL